jgi:hypothetical protein
MWKIWWRYTSFGRFVCSFKRRRIQVTPEKFLGIKTQLSKQIPKSFIVHSNYVFRKKLIEIANSNILRNDFNKFIKYTIFDESLRENFDKLKQNLIDIANSKLFPT